MIFRRSNMADYMENEEKLAKRERIKKKVGYAVGSVLLFAAACVTVPVALAKATGILYKATGPKVKDDDDWGPVIEKKERVDK